MELAALFGIPVALLDSVITARDYNLYVDFYLKNKRLPGQTPSVF
jgi:hypothetical protein